MWGASARTHVHVSFARSCLLARSSIADQGVILVISLSCNMQHGAGCPTVMFFGTLGPLCPSHLGRGGGSGGGRGGGRGDGRRSGGGGVVGQQQSGQSALQPAPLVVSLLRVGLPVHTHVSEMSQRRRLAAARTAQRTAVGPPD